jgi:hypothetical protein
MLRPFQLGDGLLHAGPTAGFGQAQATDQRRAQNENDTRQGVGDHHRAQTAPGRVEPHQQCRQQHRGPEVPAQQSFEHRGRTDEDGAEVPTMNRTQITAKNVRTPRL